jgi:catechol 2,3-dioxygenase-like lactoylglutathione lyase family enzyme
MTVIAIDHVQLAMPPGREQEARDFYTGLLGLPERPKPAELQARGGAWFEGPFAKLHLGVEKDFRPARKAHPGLLVDDLEALASRLRAAGVTLVSDDALPGQARYFVEDPFGNRIELLQAPG